MERPPYIFSLGKFWKVKVQQDDERLFFGDGWNELAAAHGLDEGFFLVFRYEGNMVFTLKIFDLSGCRKYNTAKKRKARTADEDTTDSALNNVHPGNTQSLKKKKKKKIHMSSLSEKQSEFIKVKEEPQFSKTISKYNLAHRYLYVPFPFCASNGFTTTQDVILRDSKGKSFPVNLLSYPGQTPRFRRGWRVFSKEHNLKEGDTCVFEVDSENKNIMHVQIKYKT
ncbi:hypothetical protein J5N97_025926 [Dioscorea zingiberensis]|uniref:TF-B3 domain-containing protein n=1 Tax=Dioscorea zingiberensis TaxID=325984 RepID=A0A9D5H665_9LILI|nr:hypothetical protein J5N97_025926 [Dioscorea zingiberensis]